MGRFDLYVKQSKEGTTRGACPFCHRVYMSMLCKGLEAELNLIPVNLADKPESFLKLTAAGTTPVLVDHGADDKIIADSAEIVEYIDKLFPGRNLHSDYTGPAADACAGLMGKFAGYLRNQDQEKCAEMRTALKDELQKIDAYLQSDEGKGSRFLLGDELSAIDCMIIPRLYHVQVAGGFYKGVDLSDYPALCKYLESAKSTEEWKKTHPTEDEICTGWGRYNPLKEM